MFAEVVITINQGHCRVITSDKADSTDNMIFNEVFFGLVWRENAGNVITSQDLTEQREREQKDVRCQLLFNMSV